MKFKFTTGSIVTCVCVCVCVWSVSRYDNEYGYSTRVTDLVKFVNSKDHP